LVPLGQLAEATSIGTLFAFMIVNAGVISLRRSRPNMPRSFRTPFYPVTPILGVIGCLYLILSLDVVTWIVFVIWLTIGMIIYFAYGYRKSRLATGDVPSYEQDPEPPVVQ
jgi:APA family basic amino acid/polyamine antiporter